MNRGRLILGLAGLTALGVAAYIVGMARIVWPLTGGMDAPGTLPHTARAAHIAAWCAAAEGASAEAYRILLTWVEPIFITGFAAMVFVLARGRWAWAILPCTALWLGAELAEYLLLLREVPCLLSGGLGMGPPGARPALHWATGLKLVSFGAAVTTLAAARIGGVGKPARGR